MFLKFAKYVLLSNPKEVVVICLCYIVGLSVIFDQYKLPSTFVSDPENLLNLFLMKPSMYITVGLVLIFVFATQYPLNDGAFPATVPPILRTLYALLLYVCLLISGRMVGVNFMVGSLNVVCNKNETSCLVAPQNWFPLNISGHVFTILSAILLILEEAAIFGHWCRMENSIKATEEAACCAVDYAAERKQISYDLFFRFSPFVKIIFIILAFWTLFLHASVIITAVYFHQIFEKILGALLAICHWYITYHCICISSHIATEVNKLESKSIKRYQTSNVEML